MTSVRTEDVNTKTSLEQSNNPLVAKVNSPGRHHPVENTHVLNMSYEGKNDATEAGQTDSASVSHEHSFHAAKANDLGNAIQKEDEKKLDHAQSGADMALTDPKVSVSAHEQDRQEQASRRIKEAQKYNERGKGLRQSFRRGRGGYKNNNRFDPTTQEKSDDPIAIRQQVEFYFSESNLLTDKFLFERVGGHKNIPVPIDVIHSFKRMQHFQPREAIVKALNESSILEIVDEDKAIRRKQPLPENLTGMSMDEVQKVHEDKSMAKSIYAKGFGDEEPTTQFDIEAWFANYGLTNSVRLRRDVTKSFKGSVFVEFDTEETQQEFLSLDPPPKWKGNDLEIKSKKQYCDAKVDDINKGRIRRNSPFSRKEDRETKRPRRGSADYDKRHDNEQGSDDRDWRQRRSEQAPDKYRNSKPKSHENYGRRDRRNHHGRRGGRERNNERREVDAGPLDPTHVKVLTPDLSTSNDTNKKDHTDQLSADTANRAADTTPTDGTAKRKHTSEDGGDEDTQIMKKIDLKGGSE